MLRAILFSICLIPLAGSGQDFTLNYGPEDRQFLDLYVPASDCPTPVYVDAHFNGGTTALPASMVNSLTGNGIAVASWESLPVVVEQEDVELGWQDAELMFDWLMSNADTYNLDTTQLIVGGSSRGTILSWKYAHTPNPNIQGLYMYNALPSTVWQDADWWYPADEVTADASEVFFVYFREPGCSTNPDDPDIHDPDYASIIMDTYADLGIGDRDTLIHSLFETGNTDRYQFLLDFALSVVEPCANVGVPEVSSTEPFVFPNPFVDYFQIAHVRSGSAFILRNCTGEVVWETTDWDAQDLSALDAGMHVLEVFDGERHMVLRVVKAGL